MDAALRLNLSNQSAERLEWRHLNIVRIKRMKFVQLIADAI